MINFLGSSKCYSKQQVFAIRVMSLNVRERHFLLPWVSTYHRLCDLIVCIGVYITHALKVEFLFAFQ